MQAYFAPACGANQRSWIDASLQRCESLAPVLSVNEVKLLAFHGNVMIAMTVNVNRQQKSLPWGPSIALPSERG